MTPGLSCTLERTTGVHKPSQSQRAYSFGRTDVHKDPMCHWNRILLYKESGLDCMQLLVDWWLCLIMIYSILNNIWVKTINSNFSMSITWINFDISHHLGHTYDEQVGFQCWSKFSDAGTSVCFSLLCSPKALCSVHDSLSPQID